MDDYDLELDARHDERKALENELEGLRLYKSEHERLKKELGKILDPDSGDEWKPSFCFCDLVAYVRGDLDKCRERIKDLEEENISLNFQVNMFDLL